ncbi:hypothetical protein ROA7450_01002 [Roseovarius albus]|uniref:Uncharacterized protein n=1 Tax=Roseovarius albus TaxID=1247867 RepID=A0A1X6YLG4_9RHOB|nr:hypothetical protein [Roseovarius albus]SLN24602.1 hypothetical protein ROA7450_01002 [Roseovarius albus]
MSVTKQDVLHALLSLDSYNRHEFDDQRKISDKRFDEIDSQIGTAIFQQSSDRMEETEDKLAIASHARFSASWYTLDGETVISYRRTDIINRPVQIGKFMNSSRRRVGFQPTIQHLPSAQRWWVFPRPINTSHPARFI